MSFRRSILVLLLAQVPWTALAKPFSVVVDPGLDTPEEKALTLDLVRRLESKASSRSDVVVIPTLRQNAAPSWKEVRTIANAHTPGVFVSLHFASAPSSTAKGISIFVLPPATPDSSPFAVDVLRAHAQSAFLSRRLADALTRALAPLSSGADMIASPVPLAPLVGLTLPAVLIEFGNLAGPEANVWKDPAILDSAADLLLDEVARFGGSPP